MLVEVVELLNRLKRDHQARKTGAVARRTWRGKAARAFISQPMAHSIGSAQKGLQLADGNFLVDGRLIRDPHTPIWDINSDNGPFQKAAHSFLWLDHLAANGSLICCATAREWFASWLVNFGDGNNFFWLPELAGARVIRMVNHAIILTGNTTKINQKDYFATISHHARFLKKRWHYAPDGLPRFQALVGYVYSALALEDFAKDLKPALAALTKECENYILDDGGIPTRNPEELLDIFTLLVWVAQGMTSASMQPDRALLNAIERIAPAIRTLRLGDGTLVEFHDGRASTEARLEQILQDSGARSRSTSDCVMGYSRVANAGSLLIVDTGPAAPAKEADQGFDCALAFEFSSGLYPIFKSVGSGRDLTDQRRIDNQTAGAFSVASVQPFFLGEAGKHDKQPIRLALDTSVTCQRSKALNAATAVLSTSHTGYRKAFGLTYSRRLELIPNGRVLAGTDRFFCDRKRDQMQFDKVVQRQVAHNIPFSVMFHIAPDVEAELDLGGMAVSLQLPNTEMWIFKATGGKLALEDSAYFTSERITPRATKQIVVTSDVVNYEGSVTWMLTRLES